MQTQWILFSGVLILNTVAALFLALLVGRRRNAPGSSQAATLFIALALWAFAYAMITLSKGYDTKVFWIKLENIGILSTPVLWLMFALHYTRKEKWLTRLTTLLLWIVPLISLTFLFSDTWFNLYYVSLAVSERGGPLIPQRGPWYNTQLIVSYGFLIAGLLLLFWHMFRLRGLYRRQLYFFLSGIIIPLLVNIFYQSGAKFFQIAISVDLTPISLTLTAGLISIGVFGLRMFDLIPIARNVVMENIPEMVIVVDAYNRVLDVNRTAEAWLRKPSRDIIGEDLMKIFSLWPGLAGRFQGAQDVREEIEVPGTPPRIVELIVSPLYNSYGGLEGRVIVARDITERKAIENDLLRTNQALKARIAEVDALRSKLQEQIVRDPLTGLFNRRHLTDVLDEELLKAEKKGLPVSIAVIDLDFFKKFNDTYGHKCGDAVLMSFAKMLSSKIKRDEIACRYGGEEFVIVMSGVSLEEAQERAEDWRKTMESMVFEYKNQPLFPATMSVGVAAFPLHGTDSEAVLQAADQALYQAKDNGRNKVITYQPATSA